jgi:hypothetical protein
MAKCEICEKDMNRAKGCFDRDWVIDGKRYAALKHYDRFGDGSRCGDCNAKEGEAHHPGCDMERCPLCQGQLISCDCPYEEDIFVFKTGRKIKSEQK